MNYRYNVKYMLNNILGINVFLNFASILTQKINKRTNKYNKIKN